MTNDRRPNDTPANHATGGTRVEQLTESYRFDGELATLLTAFQYAADGITLTAASPRPLPVDAIDASTPGVATVFDPASSLVFICYDERGHRMVNPIETAIITALTDTITSPTALAARSDGGTATPNPNSEPESKSGSAPLGEGPADAAAAAAANDTEDEPATADSLSMGVVTPHNAQRGALETRLPGDVTANTVEKYQGGERDIIAVSATVSDPEFARREERFILNPNRLLVAISRSRLLTVVVCPTALFEVAPADSERLDDGPVWARLFTLAVGRDSDPAWSGPLSEFTPRPVEHATETTVTVYPSTIDADTGGDQS